MLAVPVPALALPFLSLVATSGSLVAGLCLGVGLCVVARWMWKNEDERK